MGHNPPAQRLLPSLPWPRPVLRSPASHSASPAVAPRRAADNPSADEPDGPAPVHFAAAVMAVWVMTGSCRAAGGEVGLSVM